MIKIQQREKDLFKSFVFISIVTILYSFEKTRYLGSILMSILVADAITAVFHWLQDTYFSSETPLVGKVVELNRIHHDKPGIMCATPWYRTIKETTFLTLLLGPFVYPFVADKVLFFGGAFFCATSNLIHKLNHLPPSQIHGWYKFFCQGTLLQGRQCHKYHHAEADSNYCIITDFLNPILQETNIWRYLEVIVEKVTGVPPRIDEIEQN